MSLLLNKRKREESVNDSNSLRNEDTSKIHQENNNINIPEDLLIEENNIDNAQKNNKLDAFQMMFQSRNSRKEDPNNNNMNEQINNNTNNTKTDMTNYKFRLTYDEWLEVKNKQRMIFNQIKKLKQIEDEKNEKMLLVSALVTDFL